MRILVQKNQDRDIVGITNALIASNPPHEIHIWDPEENIRDIGDVDLAIISDSGQTGYKTYSALKKGTKVLFLKCAQPDFFNGDGTVISTLPHCADDKRYPPTFPERQYYCDVAVFNVLNTLNEECMGILSKIPPDLTLRIMGDPINSPNYIGVCGEPYEVSKYCLSAGVCIDFGLQTGLDLARIGCSVVTDTENNVGIPVFDIDNIEDVVRSELSKKKPVLNPYEVPIITYTQFLQYMLDTVNSVMNTQTVEVPVG